MWSLTVCIILILDQSADLEKRVELDKLYQRPGTISQEMRPVCRSIPSHPLLKLHVPQANMIRLNTATTLTKPGYMPLPGSLPLFWQARALRPILTQSQTEKAPGSSAPSGMSCYLYSSSMISKSVQ